MIGLNCGSGQRPFKSTPQLQWVNIDSQEKWSPDIQCDAMQLPYQDNSVDYVVLHHVLEHFGCGEAAGLVKEAYRVLKPKGSLLVYVPDMWRLADGWDNGKISTQIYMTNLYGAYMGNQADRHKWGYDRLSLEEFLLSCAQWKEVMQARTGQDLQGSDIAHDWWILEVECIK